MMKSNSFDFFISSNLFLIICGTPTAHLFLARAMHSLLLRPPPHLPPLVQAGLRLGIGMPEISRPFICRGPRASVVTMRDRSKNRKPTQRGRYLSTEAIQAVQSLKRACINGGDSLERVVESKVRRLVKFDMVAVLRELQSQGHALLALKVFEEVRKEHWYRPQLSLYVDMITVLARNGLHDKVEEICSYLKMECLEPDTEGFNLLFRTLLEFGFIRTTMDCFRLMKLWENEPDESTYRILIHGLEFKGEMDLSAALRHEAEIYLGRPLEFLEEKDVAFS